MKTRSILSSIESLVGLSLTHHVEIVFNLLKMSNIKWNMLGKL